MLYKTINEPIKNLHRLVRATNTYSVKKQLVLYILGMFTQL